VTGLRSGDQGPVESSGRVEREDATWDRQAAGRSFLALFQSDIDGAIRQADEFWRSLK
jgi:hypothetical protein